MTKYKYSQRKMSPLRVAQHDAERILKIPEAEVIEKERAGLLTPLDDDRGVYYSIEEVMMLCYRTHSYNYWVLSILKDKFSYLWRGDVTMGILPYVINAHKSKPKR
jgi:hypothetical protein